MLKRYLVIAGMIFSASCHKASTGGAAVDDAFSAYVSPDTQTLVAVHFDKLKSTDLYRRHEAQFNISRLDELSKRVGLDPRRDLSDMLMVWNGKHAMLIAKGSFSNNELSQKLTQDGATKQSYKGVALFVKGADAVAFPAPGVAVAGPTDAVRAAIDLASAKSGGIPEELENRLHELPADSQIVEVSRGGLPFANLALGPNLDSALSNISASINGTALGFHADSGFKLDARALCVSPEGAQRVNDTLRGLIGMARLSTKDNELDLLRMWDSFSISKDGQSVRVQADLPADLTDKLLAGLRTFRP